MVPECVSALATYAELKARLRRISEHPTCRRRRNERFLLHRAPQSRIPSRFGRASIRARVGGVRSRSADGREDRRVWEMVGKASSQPRCSLLSARYENELRCLPLTLGLLARFDSE